ncbi:MAG: hypothetical protein JWQ27_2135 [Ferruginibacter sp.]|nr:hypothetical protein [Ferruginibacter sp.]
MLLPFEILKPEYVDQLIRLEKFYLVTQSYHRHQEVFPNDLRSGILLSDYDDIGLAKIHLNAVKADPFAALIDLRREKHLAKLMSMIDTHSGYECYWAVVRSGAQIKKQVDLTYKDQVRRYIEKNTNWRIGASAKINPHLQLVFGEIFMVLKYGNQTLRIKFEDIERS